jgi:hypothetical protein
VFIVFLYQGFLGQYESISILSSDMRENLALNLHVPQI